MKKSLAVILLAILGSCFLQVNLSAQVPQFLTYQGRLDSSGVLLNGVRTLTFSVYSDSAGTSLLWRSDPQANTVVNGVFSAQFGPIPNSIFSSSGDRWLGIKVGASAGDMTPRFRITSVVFSMRASLADTAAYARKAALADSARISSAVARPISPGVSTAEIADNAVTGAKIADGTITGADIASSTIGLGNLNFTPPSRPLSPRITSNEMGDTSITGQKVKDSTLTGRNIARSSITSVNILDEPGIAYGFKSPDYYIYNSTAAMDTITIKCPGPGFIFIIASGNFKFWHYNPTKNDMRASLSTIPAVIDPKSSVEEIYDQNLPTSATYVFKSFSVIRVDAVSSGSFTYYLNIDSQPGSTYVNQRTLVAQFFPAWYGAKDPPALGK